MLLLLTVGDWLTSTALRCPLLPFFFLDIDKNIRAVEVSQSPTVNRSNNSYNKCNDNDDDNNNNDNNGNYNNSDNSSNNNNNNTDNNNSNNNDNSNFKGNNIIDLLIKRRKEELIREGVKSSSNILTDNMSKKHNICNDKKENETSSSILNLSQRTNESIHENILFTSQIGRAHV